VREKLARHGIGLDDAVLDDRTRHLLPRRAAPPRASAQVLRRLDEVLDDLERALPAAEAARYR